MRVTLVLISAAILSGSALADGPGGSGITRTLRSADGNLVYTASSATGSRTRVTLRRGARLVRSVTIQGSYGVAVPVLRGDGLSHDGRTLVLARLERTGFAVLDARTLRMRRRIELHGMFTFDALSPTGRTLYLVQHRLSNSGDRYTVRAYDLARGRLLPQVVFDRREGERLMSGWPVRRATGPTGRWAYTLYVRSPAGIFVHALDTVDRHAFCIDVPWSGSSADVWHLKLTLAPGRLDITNRGRLVARIDTKHLRLTKTSRP